MLVRADRKRELVVGGIGFAPVFGFQLERRHIGSKSSAGSAADLFRLCRPANRKACVPQTVVKMPAYAPIAMR
jgi:hypothetical protein